jgi:hypothetical protein
VHEDLAVVVAERLERRDLTALELHEAREHDVEQERRDQQEERRELRRHVLELPELLGEEVVRELSIATVRAEPAVATEHLVDAVDDGSLVGSGHDREHRLVEGALHVERRLRGVAAHPDHRAFLRVHRDLARAEHDHELRREPHPHHAHLAPHPADHERDAGTAAEAVRFGERVREHHLVVAAFLREPPFA